MGFQYKGRQALAINVSLVFVLFFVLQSTAFAVATFRQTRVDAYLPAQCKNIGIQNFDPNFKTLVYGVVDAKSKGFSHEWPITRQEAALLWAVFYGITSGERNVGAEQRLAQMPQLRDDFEIFKKFSRGMGFSFAKEGDLLEMFALYDLQKAFNPNEYFFTGGFEYSENQGSTIGELDILVGRKADCKILVVGEAKLGYQALGHAKQQIARFAGFLKGQIGRSTGQRNLLVYSPQIRQDGRGQSYDQYGYLMNYDQDVYGRGYYFPYRFR